MIGLFERCSIHIVRMVAMQLFNYVPEGVVRQMRDV